MEGEPHILFGTMGSLFSEMTKPSKNNKITSQATSQPKSGWVGGGGVEKIIKNTG